MDWLWLAMLALMVALVFAIHRYMNRPGGYIQSAKEPDALIVDLVKEDDTLIFDEYGDMTEEMFQPVKKIKQQQKSRPRKDKQ